MRREARGVGYARLGVRGGQQQRVRIGRRLGVPRVDAQCGVRRDYEQQTQRRGRGDEDVGLKGGVGGEGVFGASYVQGARIGEGGRCGEDDEQG